MKYFTIILFSTFFAKNSEANVCSSSECVCTQPKDGLQVVVDEIFSLKREILTVTCSFESVAPDVHFSYSVLHTVGLIYVEFPLPSKSVHSMYELNTSFYQYHYSNSNATLLLLLKTPTKLNYTSEIRVFENGHMHFNVSFSPPEKPIEQSAIVLQTLSNSQSFPRMNLSINGYSPSEVSAGLLVCFDYQRGRYSGDGCNILVNDEANEVQCICYKEVTGIIITLIPFFVISSFLICLTIVRYFSMKVSKDYGKKVEGKDVGVVVPNDTMCRTYIVTLKMENPLKKLVHASVGQITVDICDRSGDPLITLTTPTDVFPAKDFLWVISTKVYTTKCLDVVEILRCVQSLGVPIHLYVLQVEEVSTGKKATYTVNDDMRNVQEYIGCRPVMSRTIFVQIPELSSIEMRLSLSFVIVIVCATCLFLTEPTERITINDITSTVVSSSVIGILMQALVLYCYRNLLKQTEMINRLSCYSDEYVSSKKKFFDFFLGLSVVIMAVIIAMIILYKVFTELCVWFSTVLCALPITTFMWRANNVIISGSRAVRRHKPPVTQKKSTRDNTQKSEEKAEKKGTILELLKTKIAKSSEKVEETEEDNSYFSDTFQKHGVRSVSQYNFTPVQNPPEAEDEDDIDNLISELEKSKIPEAVKGKRLMISKP